MTTLARWNPFKAATRMDPIGNFPISSFDDMFRSLASRPLWREMEMTPDMRLDVTDKDNAYLVKADLPGVDKHDIEISVEGNQVAISAEVKRSTEQKNDEQILCSERYYGRIYRSFSLPTEIDSTKADAHYEGGVLTLTLPKTGNASSRRIMVS
jgi:HSP20 family protein